MTNWQLDALKKLEDFGLTYADEFKLAEPFPHCYIDNFVDSELITELISEFPTTSDPIWEASTQEGIQVKLRSNWQEESDIKPVTKSVVHFLNSGAVMKQMSRLTGIEKLISDPYYTGGGLNCTKRDGLLDVHVDGNWHHAMGIHRRLNVILYLNEVWDPQWGGALELWDDSLSKCVKSIDPVGNRLVIFETHDRTYHGHPNPLRCPPEESRKSLILYYYTAASRPESQIVVEQPHRALWRKRQMRELT
jgi:Rps23 Pro-64 3,4-dihydroxylase Tpa1-like proline 4-hydroxylase